MSDREPRKYTGKYARGSVWTFVFDRQPYTETGKEDRPWVIVSEDISNERSQQVIVVELETWDGLDTGPTQVLLRKDKVGHNILEADSIANCRAIHTVSKANLFQQWGDSRLPPDVMKEISSALSIALALRFYP